MPRRILLVANQTAATPALLDAVRTRAEGGEAQFHLVVPATSHGLHRVVDPEDAGTPEAEQALAAALPALEQAAGGTVTAEVGDGSPLTAIEDAVNAGAYDEIVISTLPTRVSRWMKLDLPSKAEGFGLPVTHVVPDEADA